MTRVARGLREWSPAVLVAVVVVIGWEIAIDVFDVERFLLPKPSEIWTALQDERAVLWDAGWYTFTEALWGFALGSGSAIVAAIVLARFRRVGGALMPYFIAANAIPIIAFAPIANAWFGIEKGSKIAIAAVLCFFPVTRCAASPRCDRRRSS